jgi:general secretion pathway protein D
MKQTSHWILVLTVAALAAGCAASRLHHDGVDLIKAGKVEEGLVKLSLAVEKAPTNPVYRSDFLAQRDAQLEKLLAAGKAQRTAEHWQDAGSLFERARAIAPLDPRPQDALIELARARGFVSDLDQARADVRHGDIENARDLVGSVQARDPGNRDAAALMRQIDDMRARDRADNPVLRSAGGKAVSLRFADGSVRMILEAIGRMSGLTIMIDRDIRPDLVTNIVVEKVSAEDAINLVIQTAHLRRKVLDSNTVLIYPATPDKIRDYEDLVVKGFHISNADAKRTEALLKGLMKTEDIFVDEKQNLIVVRGPIEQIQIAEKLVALHDVKQPEVMLEVQVMEVNRSRVTELGVSYPNQATLSRIPSSSSGTTLADFKKINPSVISLVIPSTVVNLNEVITDGDLLANPRIRVRNREHAKILIGDKLPVVTTTATSTGFVSENIQYLDVGLKLDVEPDISLDDNVSINLSLEVSSVVKQITTPGGSLAYDIGTRDASTVLELKDGETEILAGLISDNDTRTATGIPTLGQFPVVGRLFSSHKTDHEKSEIILAITPHIVRGYRPTVASDSQFWSGTANRPRTQPFVLHHPGQPAIAVAAVDDSIPLLTPAKGGGVSPTSPAVAAKSVTLSWRGPTQVKVGDTFTVALHISADGEIHSLPIQASYEQGSIDIVQVQEGGYFKGEGSQSLFASNIDATTSKVLVSAGRAGAEGVGGEGDVAILTLKARAPKAGAVIRIIAASPLLADGQPLNAALPDPYAVTITE